MWRCILIHGLEWVSYVLWTWDVSHRIGRYTVKALGPTSLSWQMVWTSATRSFRGFTVCYQLKLKAVEVQVKPLTCPHQCQCFYSRLRRRKYQIKSPAHIGKTSACIRYDCVFSLLCLHQYSSEGNGSSCCNHLCWSILVEYVSVCAFANSSLSFCNACCWAFTHLNGTSFLVNILSGSPMPPDMV